jgi:hypothetical protein
MSEEMFMQWVVVAMFAVFAVAVVVLMALSLRLDSKQEARRRRAKHVTTILSGSATKENN